MNEFLKNKEFCDDFTRDALSEQDLASICSATVRTARRRRTIRRAGAGALFLIPMLAFWLRPQRETGELVERTNPNTPPPHTVVHTAAFTNIIVTEAFSPNTAFFAGIEEVAVLSPSAAPGYHELSDEELLGFFEGRSVALFRLPNGEVNLRFLDEEHPGN